ncbi:type II methionyl aminopeptidase [Candidatus Micrarchaeota archaeon]|nr:type II methionyl aminopeptidase [Candidatus Micrarchaeota archaeon]
MSDEHLHYLEAARVAASVREIAEDFVKPGVKLLDAAEKIESEIQSQGAFMGFQACLSLNEAAAHDTPAMNDGRVLKDSDVVKVDFGVHVEGCIIDQAFTFNASNEHEKLVSASKQALDDALSVMRAGKTVKDVGQAISDAITKAGFRPIENLCGHSLAPWVVHAGVSVPNVPVGDYVLKEDDVFAVEPFATNGAGRVEDGSVTEIYALVDDRGARLPQSRNALQWIHEQRQTLPFAKRHLLPVLRSEASVNLAVRDLLRQGILREYPILNEVNAGMVSQAETTVIVEKDSVRVLV